MSRVVIAIQVCETNPDDENQQLHCCLQSDVTQMTLCGDPLDHRTMIPLDAWCNEDRLWCPECRLQAKSCGHSLRGESGRAPKRRSQARDTIAGAGVTWRPVDVDSRIAQMRERAKADQPLFEAIGTESVQEQPSSDCETVPPGAIE